MWKRVKNHLSSVNLTLFLIACLIGVFKGIDPCDKALTHFMSIAGIETMEAGIEYPGPTELSVDLEIALEDGRTIRVLKSGAISITE
ncbi:MAG: hypothetical protein ACXAEN_21830 [Candidatus Thorarchaeota archaeon]|jgi:hypothetical protein